MTTPVSTVPLPVLRAASTVMKCHEVRVEGYGIVQYRCGTHDEVLVGALADRHCPVAEQAARFIGAATLDALYWRINGYAPLITLPVDDVMDLIRGTAAGYAR